MSVFLTFTKKNALKDSSRSNIQPPVPQKRLFTLAGDAKADLQERLRII